MKFSEAVAELIENMDEFGLSVVYENNGAVCVGKWYDDHMLKFESANADREAIVYKQRGKLKVVVID